MKLIVTDLDKTLLTDEKTITMYTADVLHKCRELGIVVAYATARPFRTAYTFEFLPDFIISNNGATISRANGTVIYNNNISTDVRDTLFATLVAMNEVTCLTVEIGDCLLTNYSGIPWDSANWNPVYCDFSEPLTSDTPKISIECKDRTLLNGLISQYPDLHVYFNNGEDWCQVMHRDSTKMNAIRFLTEHLGISLDDVAAFGDDSNDVEMLQMCGKGIAVENAIQQAKQAADYVCLGNNHDGVAKWIDAELLHSAAMR